MRRNGTKVRNISNSSAYICIAGNFITSYFEQTGTLETGFFMVADQRVGVGSYLRKIPLGYFNDSSSGALCATLTTTLSGVETAGAMVMVGVVSRLFSAFVLFVFMLFYDWRIGILSGIGMITYLLIVNYQMSLSRKNAPALQKVQNDIAKSTQSFL